MELEFQVRRAPRVRREGEKRDALNVEQKSQCHELDYVWVSLGNAMRAKQSKAKQSKAT